MSERVTGSESGSRQLESAEFPGYRLQEVLRSSRAGVWIRARQSRIGRDVLLKVPPRGDLKALSVLRREVETLRESRHQGLITVFDFWGDRDVPFGVYELPATRTLEDWVESAGPKRLEDVVELSWQIAEILRELHRQGVHLRHAGPADFFVDENGRVCLACLEAAGPEGPPRSQLSPLWISPEGSGEAGDSFLVGLLCVYMVTGTVPVPQTVLAQPGGSVQRVSECLRDRSRFPTGEGSSASADPRRVVAVIERLLRSPRQELSGEAADHLRELRREPVERVGSSASPSARATPGRVAVLVPTLLVGIALGALLWHGGPWSGPRNELPDGAGSDPSLASSRRPQVGKPAPPSPTTGSDGTAVPDESGPKPLEPTVSAPTVTLTQSAEAPPAPAPLVDVSRRESEPATDPGATAPGPSSTAHEQVPPRVPLQPLPEPPGVAEQFLTRWSDVLKRTDDASERDLDVVWRDGVQLARAASGEVPGELTDALIAVGAERERRRILADFGAGEVRGREGLRYSIKYDFSSRRQLADWQAVGSDSRVDLLDGRMVMLGDVRFKPNVWYRDGLRMRWRIPRSKRAPARDSTRPNINLVVQFAGESDIAVPDPRGAETVLFGVGTRFDAPTLRSADAGRVRWPAAVILHAPSGAALVSGDDPIDGVAIELVWFEKSSDRNRHWSRGEEFELEWGDALKRWTVDDRAVIPEKEQERLLEGLAGKRFGFGFQTFDSPVEFDEIELEVSLDGSAVSAEAWRLAGLRLREALSGK